MYDTGKEPTNEEEKGKTMFQGPGPWAHSTKSALDSERTIETRSINGELKVDSRKARLSKLSTMPKLACYLMSSQHIVQGSCTKF